MNKSGEQRIRAICAAMQELTNGQVGWIETVVSRFQEPATFSRLPESDLIDD